MSFNYLEIARATELIAKALPDEVQSVELVRFPLTGAGAGGLPDVNVAIRLKHSRQLIVFSLKQPWTAVYFTAPGFWASAAPKGLKPVWAVAFNGCEGPAQDWNAFLAGASLEQAKVVSDDRIVELAFGNGARLRVELFPSRPNWVLTAGGQEFCWRSSAAALNLRPRGAAFDKGSGASSPGFSVREFESFSGGNWMERAYRHYQALRQAALLQTQRQRAAAQLQSRLTRLIKIRGQMEDSLEESAKADQLKRDAETLKARLYELPRGQKTKAIDGIKLDPRHSVADNVTLMFSRYKKLLRTKREVEARLIGIEEESRKITGTIARLRAFQGDYAGFLKLLEQERIPLEEERAPGKKENKQERKWRKSSHELGLRQFQSKEGVSIWVGRNHKENEELVIRLARGNDLWMHLKGKPGAHVIVQLPGAKSASLETLLDGATLVAYYSGVSDKEKVEVDYTLRKHVKRVPGGGEKFLVTYTQNKTLMLKMEDERLWRLLKQH